MSIQAQPFARLENFAMALAANIFLQVDADSQRSVPSRTPFVGAIVRVPDPPPPPKSQVETRGQGLEALPAYPLLPSTLTYHARSTFFITTVLLILSNLSLLPNQWCQRYARCSQR